VDFSTAIEIGFGLYFTAVVVYAGIMGIYGVIPFLMLFQAGFLYTGLSSFAQEAKRFLLASPLSSLARPRLSRSVD